MGLVSLAAACGTGSVGSDPTSEARSASLTVDASCRPAALGESLFGVCPPATAATADDPDSVTLGVRFVPAVSGVVRGVRFYRGADAPFPVAGFPVGIYDLGGAQLASGSATLEQNPSSGWMTGPLNHELRVVAGQTYVAAYLAPTGRYSYEHQGLSGGFTAPKLSAPADGGVYAYGPSLGYPDQTYLGSNYFVDLTLIPDPATSDPCRPAALGESIFGICPPPGAATADDPDDLTLGVTFVPKAAGTLRAVRFYRGDGAPFPIGGFPVAVYDGAGNSLATGNATLGQNPSSGWMTAPLDREIRLKAGHAYVAAYFARGGRYSFQYGLLSQGLEAPQLTVTVDGGVYVYGSPLAFPFETFRGSSYFVDVTFFPDDPCLRYQVTDLGLSPGEISSSAAALDATGLVAGTYQISAPNGRPHAFVWTSAGGTRDLGTLGGDTSFAAAASDGRVAGQSQTAGGRYHAFVTDAAGLGLVDLGTLGAAGVYDISNATGINASGAVVGASRLANGFERAVRWQGGSITDLGTLVGTDTSNSRALAVNDAGQIVGVSDSPAGLPHAALWNNGKVIDLGGLGGSSTATAINAGGDAVGSATLGVSRPVLFRAGTVVDLGVLDALPGFNNGGSATAINAGGLIVGTVAGSSGQTGTVHVFLYRAGTVLDLNDLIGTAGGPMGWTINQANGLDDRGRIAAVATRASRAHAVLLAPECALAP